jgi:c-di-GMP-binding flagellar brake protein YcgR
LEEERRRYLRVKKSFPFQFTLRGTPEVYECTTYDISQGGIGFFSPVPIDIQNILHIRMKIPGFDETMAIRGIARWRNETEDGRIFIGVEFFNIEIDEKKIILKALREH